MRSLDAAVDAGEFAAAAWVATPFLAVLLIALRLQPPVSGALAGADPLVQLGRALGGTWLLPVLCAVGIGAWLVGGRRALAETGGLGPVFASAAAGAAGAMLVAVVLRVIFGPELPSFIPPEESAKPGLAQGLEAGLFEEVAFRLAVLPAVYFSLRRRTGEVGSKAVAILVTGLAFAASHELGPGAHGFEPRFFVTRFVFPGCIMSAGCFWLSPSFVVAAHGTAHLVLPALFR